MPTPDELLNDEIAQLPAPKRIRRSGQETVTWPFALPIEVGDLVKDAAAARGMSIHSYMRRAITAFAAYDHGIPFRELAENELAVTKPNDTGRGVKMHGAGHGPWRILGLTDER